MKNKKKIIYALCIVVSMLLLLWFVVQTALFLLDTAERYQSFGEAVKRLLLFAISAGEPAVVLAFSVVLSGVCIKLSSTPKQKKLARGIFIGEMIVLAIYALILLSMFVVFPEEWTGRT